jgi:hypothetical protein
LNRLYGLRTSTVYDVDGVAARLGSDLIGFEERSGTFDAMREADDLHFIKTHRPRDDQVHEADRAICLVRDGRDALVSWARQRIEGNEVSFDSELRARIDEPHEVGAGSWGHNILSWLTPPAAHRPMLRYEDLISDPTATVERIMTRLAPKLQPIEHSVVPSFAELRQLDARFFRRGHPGTHHDEMTDELHRQFWSQPDNIAAMNLLGYGQPGLRA